MRDAAERQRRYGVRKQKGTKTPIDHQTLCIPSKRTRILQPILVPMGHPARQPGRVADACNAAPAWRPDGSCNVKSVLARAAPLAARPARPLARYVFFANG